MTKKIILAGLMVLGSVELSAYTYEVNPLLGKNFTESGALVDDSTAYGIRINKYISPYNAIMFGYTRMDNVDYKGRATTTKKTSSYTGCPPKTCPPKTCPPTTSSSTNCGTTNTANTNNSGTNSSNSSANNSNNQNNSGTNSSNSSVNNSNNQNNTGTNSSNSSTTNNTNHNNNTTNGSTSNTTGTNSGKGTGVTTLGSSRTYSTDINRFYINGLHNIQTSYSRLVPYVYGGFGYEHVENEFADNDSQGFFNAGGGLKYRVNDRFSLVSDIQGVKKFKSHDFDILGSVGVSYLFGSLLQVEPKPVVNAGLEDVHPAPVKREITVVKVAPQPVETAPIVVDVAPKGEYYVQIAAGFKTDMETGCKHTRDLREAGIDYDIKYTTIKGKNAALVVVGPFETREEAKAQLPSLRKYSKDAFVRKIKN